MSEIILRNVRASFPALFEAQEFKGKKRYGCRLLIPKDDPQLKELAKLEAAAIAERYKGPAPKSYIKLVSDSDQEGYVEVRAYRQEKQRGPIVLDRDATLLTEDTGVIYGGCYIDAKISIYVPKSDSHRGCATLMTVQFRRDGDSFGHRLTLKDGEFTPIVDDVI